MKANIFIRKSKNNYKLKLAHQGQQENAQQTAQEEYFYAMSIVVNEEEGVYERIDGFIVPKKEARIQIMDALDTGNFFTGETEKGPYMGVTVEFTPDQLLKIGKKTYLTDLVGVYCLEKTE